MLLTNRLRDPNGLFAVGGFSLVFGVSAQRFVHPASDFWQGTVAGLSAVLIGLSLVCNVRGLMLQRRLGQHGGR